MYLIVTTKDNGYSLCRFETESGKTFSIHTKMPKKYSARWFVELSKIIFLLPIWMMFLIRSIQKSDCILESVSYNGKTKTPAEYLRIVRAKRMGLKIVKKAG